MLKIILLSLCVLTLMNGCADFLRKEMNVYEDDKLRPFAIIVEPPEAAPGETVSVTIQYYQPDGAQNTILWRAALDFDFDIYGDLETERNYLYLEEIQTIPAPIVDENGLATQSFSFTVPDSTILVSTALQGSYDSSEIPAHLLPLLGAANDDYITKSELDAFFRDTDFDQLYAILPAEDVATIIGLSEIFACQIRLRAKIRGGIHLDVIKNFTVRWAGDTGSEYLNANPIIGNVALLAIDHPDVDDADDIGQYDIDTTYIYHSDPAQIESGPVSIDPQKSYYIFVTHDEQDYYSPAGYLNDEEYFYSWHYTSLDGMSSEVDFFYQEDEGEGDATDFEEFTRLLPGKYGLHQKFRMFIVVRDYRPEWRIFNGTTGVDFVHIDLELDY
jgi:hypothetical protein